MNDMKKIVLDAMQFRHACKEFDPEKKISDEDFAFLLETARLSPSSFGFEPWKILVVESGVLKQKLASVTWGVQRQMPGASRFIVILARKKNDMLSDSEYITRMLAEVHSFPEDMAAQRRGKYKNFIENDFRLLDSDRSFFEWSVRQTYILLANMMTSAALIGIDSCPIEGFNQEQVERILEVEGLLDNGRVGVSCMCVFGYRKNEPRKKTRQKMEDIVQYV